MHACIRFLVDFNLWVLGMHPVNPIFLPQLVITLGSKEILRASES